MLKQSRALLQLGYLDAKDLYFSVFKMAIEKADENVSLYEIHLSGLIRLQLVFSSFFLSVFFVCMFCLCVVNFLFWFKFVRLWFLLFFLGKTTTHFW